MNASARQVTFTLAVPSFVIGTDFVGAMMLLMPIERTFDVDVTTAQWVVNIYALTFASCLVAGGRLSDLFGGRTFLVGGLIVFILASFACALAPTVTWLIVGRAVQGIGTALMWPAILNVAANAVDERDRGSVFGVLLGAIGIGNILSLGLVGGAEGLGNFRLFFFVTGGLAVFSLLMALILRLPPPQRVREKIDYAGMLLVGASLLLLLYGLDVGADWGWSSPPLWALFAAAIVLIATFPLVEARVVDPMMPPALMRNGQLIRALSMNAMIVPAYFLVLVYLPQLMAKVHGWPLWLAFAGVAPIGIAQAMVSLRVGRHYHRVGPRRLMLMGHALVIAATIMIAWVPTSWGYWPLVIPMAVLGLGGGLTFSTAGTAAVNATETSRAGLVGSLSYIFHLGIGALSVAAGTAILFSVSLSRLGERLSAAGVDLTVSQQRALNAGATDTVTVGAALGSDATADVDAVQSALASAFAAGFHAVCLFGIVAAVLGILIAASLDDQRLGRLSGTQSAA